MDASLPSGADSGHALLHERMRTYPDYLSYLLLPYDPASMTDETADEIRDKLRDYTRSADSDPSVAPIVALLERSLLDEFEQWLHRGTRDAYRRYLGSDPWQRTRQKVLVRADYLCEGCRERTATQVHHLHYEYPRGEEFCFDLVALCGQCHQGVHQREKVRREGA